MRIGIDIGGMSIKLGIVNEKNQIIAKKVISTDSHIKAQEEIGEAIAMGVCELTEEAGIMLSECDCVGVACPGTVDAESGVVLYSNNLGWEKFPLIELMEQYISVPIALANDADAAALGEVVCGAAKGKNSAILLTLGTGVGGGVILDGKIFTGSLRGGCELGHMVIQQGEKLCTCGRRGCFEQYASATALMNAAREAAMKNTDTILWDLCNCNLSELRCEHIFDAARMKDAVAKMVLERYEDYLSNGIANIINIFRPEIVILGGGVSAQGQNLTSVLQGKVRDMCFGGEYGEIPPIVTSVLGNDAGIIGASHLCSGMATV